MVVIEIGLLLAALIDLDRRKEVVGRRLVWVLVIIFLDIIGPILYFVFGRKGRSEKRN